jgi:hypothetical protein
MRGCDAVSFVFGLEVTWSLIQQRQQEEEERLAFEELECIRDGEDGESDDDGEVLQVKRQSSPCKAQDGSPKDCEPTDAPGDVDDETSEEELDAAGDDSPNPCVDAVAVPCYDSTPSSVEARSSCVDILEEIDEVATVEKAATQSCWPCGVCTLLNKKASRKCSACGTKSQ